MKLTLLNGDHHPSTLPHPTVFKCQIIRASGNRSQVLTYIGPMHRVPAGWCVVMSRPT
jgi:hypothetical protein